MVQKIQGAQRDFSFGEIDVALKRSDEHPARKAGLRQMANARILNSGAIQNRSGRRALFPTAAKRIEEFSISAGNIFKIAFAAGEIQIINSVGAVVQTFTLQGNGAALPWATQADINSIDYAIFNLTLTLTFGHAMRPQVISFDGVATWTIADYTEAILVSGQKRTPFYRISPQNITMQPTATAGIIGLTFSAPVTVPGMVGTRMRYCGRQLTILTVAGGGLGGTAVVNEPLPFSQALALTGSVGNFALGDEVVGSVSGAQGIVTSSPTQQEVGVTTFFTTQIQLGDAITGATSGATGVVNALVSIGAPGFYKAFTVALSTSTAFIAAETVTGPNGSITSFQVSPVTMFVQLLQNDAGNLAVFSTSDLIAGPSGHAGISGVTAEPPQAVSVWDDEVMNTFRGFPGSVFVDQFRLGFCDFPSVPGGIGWSAINSPTDFYPNAVTSPDNAIFELTPAKTRVRYVVPGPEGSEFVFCDNRLFYIPISTSSPLAPGSVGFNLLSGDGAAPVKPRIAQEAILYVNAGQNSVRAIIATGAYTRPFNTKDLSEFHQHLFNNIKAIAAPNADGTFNERYAYVLNGDGSIAVGKYNPESLQTNQPVIGWGPWSGAAAVSWVAAWNADVLFTSIYSGTGICEILDDTQYLDGAVLVNSLPAPFTPPGGKGPLYLLYPGQPVTLMDQVTRAMGTYQVDANGNIIPQFNGGENLAIASLVAGQPWTMTAEPFCPDANPGTDMGQRMFKRRVSRFAAYVENSTGFLMARLFSGPITPATQAAGIVLGTIMNTRRVPAWNIGDNPILPPPLREEAQRWRPIGRSFDPRVAIIKDTPGPLLLAELGMEATI